MWNSLSSIAGGWLGGEEQPNKQTEATDNTVRSFSESTACHCFALLFVGDVCVNTETGAVSSGQRKETARRFHCLCRIGRSGSARRCECCCDRCTHREWCRYRYR